MPTPISPFVFEGFPNNDWESATPPLLMEAVLSVQKLAGDGFFRIDTLLKKEESIRRETRPWVSFGACYTERKREAQRVSSELFDAFLQIAEANRALISASPVAWAYGQTDALLRMEFGSAQSAQEFYKIKLWITEYCDGRDQSPVPATQSAKDWKEHLCRESWRAPVWFRMAASRHFTNDTSAWGDLSDQSALQRLDKEETEALLDGICRYFWSAVKAALENKARRESINFAAQAGAGHATGSQVESTQQTLQKQSSVDAPELSKGVSEGRTVDQLHGQMKKIRKLYREKGLTPSQIRQATNQDLAVVWEWIDRISDVSRKSEFLKVADWDDGDGWPAGIPSEHSISLHS